MAEKAPPRRRTSVARPAVADPTKETVPESPVSVLETSQAGSDTPKREPRRRVSVVKAAGGASPSNGTASPGSESAGSDGGNSPTCTPGSTPKREPRRRTSVAAARSSPLVSTDATPAADAAPSTQAASVVEESVQALEGSVTISIPEGVNAAEGKTRGPRRRASVARAAGPNSVGSSEAQTREGEKQEEGKKTDNGDDNDDEDGWKKVGEGFEDDEEVEGEEEEEETEDGWKKVGEGLNDEDENEDGDENNENEAGDEKDEKADEEEEAEEADWGMNSIDDGTKIPVISRPTTANRPAASVVPSPTSTPASPAPAPAPPAAAPAPKGPKTTYKGKWGIEHKINKVEIEKWRNEAVSKKAGGGPKKEEEEKEVPVEAEKKKEVQHIEEEEDPNRIKRPSFLVRRSLEKYIDPNSLVGKVTNTNDVSEKQKYIDGSKLRKHVQARVEQMSDAEKWRLAAKEKEEARKKKLEGGN